jgi:hypothetical protein
MAANDLTASEKAFLILLMAENREVSNVELAERYGISLTGKERKALNDQKLVTSRKAGRGLAHELTDQGWARCKEELTAPYVKGTGPGYPALHALLGALHRYLETSGQSLPELFEPGRSNATPLPFDTTSAKPAAVKPAATKTTAANPNRAKVTAAKVPAGEVSVAAASAVKATGVRPTAATTAKAAPGKRGSAKPVQAPQALSTPVPAPRRDLESQLIAAYHRKAARANQWVALADIRDELKDSATRDEVDETLRRLSAQRRIMLQPEVNQKTLKARDREAALQFGGEAVHSLRTAG